MFKISNINKNICKICFKSVSNSSIYTFVNKNVFVCPDCYEKLNPHFRKFKLKNYAGVSIYDYDDKIQGFLYQLKGCYDIELSSIFLERYKNELRMLYHDFIIIPAPSSKEDDEQREFNHVIEIFNSLQIPVCRCIFKKEKYKQSDHSAKDRQNIEKILEIDEKTYIKGRKILLVDDVFTTGSTLKAMIKLIEPFKPKKIKILVMSKTKFKT